MAGLTRTVHPRANFAYRRLAEVAPDLSLHQLPAIEDGQREEPMALVFTDPDSESHVYVFSESGRQALIRELTGGIMLPGSLS